MRIAAAALVTGHALSVFVAHAEALRLFPYRRQAIRSQLPMMVFMVGLTSLSLWILAQPIVAWGVLQAIRVAALWMCNVHAHLTY